jgi:PAS domain S-box-containing protein
MPSVTEILTYLSNNDAANQIETSLKRWISNQMEIVGKHDISAEDITLLNHVRGRSLKHFAFEFYRDSALLYELNKEIDDFLLASNTSAANTYIAILKDQIREEEEFRSKLSNALPGFIYVYDVQHKIQTFSNDKLEEILGYNTDEIRTLSYNFYQTIIHPEEWDKILDQRSRYNKNNAAISSFECRVKNIDGNYEWMRFYETILRTDPDGKVREIIGVAFDISSEKEITQALAISEAQLLEAQSIAHIGSFEWDISGQSSTTNTPEIYRIFEMEKMEKFEKFMQYVHREDVQKVEEAMKLSFQTGEYECVYRYLRNGKEKIIWSKGIVTIEEGKPVKMIGTVQDVTTIKRIEEELKRKTIELESSNESLQQFAAIASHDLKEPLRKISIYGSKLLNAEKNKLTEASYTALSKIFDSTGRMQRMIDDILQFSFIDGNLQKRQTDLEEVLSEVKDLLSESISSKKAEIISDGLPSAFVIGPQMVQLFQNLIANALKFSKQNEPPKITISHSYFIDKPTASTANRYLEICIADDGIGFDDSDKEKIFDLFYRLPNNSRLEGTGLGLSIVRKIVEKHSGTIKAISKIGEGSKFIIQLPQ